MGEGFPICIKYSVVLEGALYYCSIIVFNLLQELSGVFQARVKPLLSGQTV